MRRAQELGPAFVCFAALMLFLPSSASGQSWRTLDAFGYGALGAVAGAAATLEADCSGYICATHFVGVFGGFAVGAVSGASMGGRADDAVAQGRPVHGVHRGGVALGTLLAGSALGAVASVPLINGEGSGTFLGSDEQTVTVLAVLGAGLGALHVGRRWGELTGTTFEIGPTAVDSGRPGVLARLRF